MAIVKLGPIVSEISGSIKNVTFAKYKRLRHLAKVSRAAGSNPQSLRQALIRKANQEASSIWSDTLTPRQRANWNGFALSLASKSVGCGGIRELIKHNGGIMSGYHAFVMCYTRVIMSGITLPANFNDSPLGLTSSAPITGLAASFVASLIPNFALLFDGVDERITLGNVLGYEYNQPQSWEMWVYPLGSDPGDWLISKYISTLDHGYILGLTSGSLAFQINRFAAAEHLQVTRAFPFLNTWKHVVMTYDGSNSANGIKLYIDTVVGQVVTQNVPMTGSIKTTDPLVFGTIDASPPHSANVRLDCIRNYNRVINQAEVNALWNGGAGLYSTNPFGGGSCIGAWMFCSGEGNTLVDIAGFGLNGTLVNMEPGDWVPGKVPCPEITNFIDITWTDPVNIQPFDKIRIWIRSRELGVHKQLIYSVDAGVEELRLFQVRMSQGALHDITDFPGHYLIQADVIRSRGRLSAPSNTVEVTVP